jgi:hypothetical protein
MNMTQTEDEFDASSRSHFGGRSGAGPLRVAHEGDPYLPTTATYQEKRQFIPKGCDQQGRIPQAAHASTEVGAEPAWTPVSKLESLKFWSAVLGVPAVVIAIGLWAAWK